MRAAWGVSVKGVVLDPEDRVLLLRNERAEWELPGGNLEPGETPEECVAREIHEETGWNAEAAGLLDVWVYEPLPGRRVLIVTFGCRLLGEQPAPVLSHEHKELGLFPVAEVAGLVMPQGYKDSVSAFVRRRSR